MFRFFVENAFKPLHQIATEANERHRNNPFLNAKEKRNNNEIDKDKKLEEPVRAKIPR